MLLEAAIREYEEVAGLRSRAIKSATAREEQLYDALAPEQRLRVRGIAWASGSLHARRQTSPASWHASSTLKQRLGCTGTSCS